VATERRRERAGRFYTRGIASALALSALLGTVWAAQGLRADTGPSPVEHRVEQARPILLGTSGGNVADRTKRFCCSGTLGALVGDNSGRVYVLSNNHVLGRSNRANVGEVVSQPGAIDQSPTCAIDANDAVAHFTALVPLSFFSGKTRPLNLVDAAIAEVVPGKVAADGAQLDIGPVSPYLPANDASARRQIPEQLDAVPVEIVVTGPFVAF
jgi:hypothetical protein